MVVPLTLPETLMEPKLPITAPLAVAPYSTTSSPPLLTTVALAEPPS